MDVPRETSILRSQSMSYTSGSHTVFHHRYHIVWITKDRYKVLEGALRARIRTIIRQMCRELGVQIVSGVLSREHVHMFVEIPPHIASRDGHRIGCRWSSRTCASATGGGIFGLGATSPPRAATSRTLSYFSIFRSTNLPASAGSYSVGRVGEMGSREVVVLRHEHSCEDARGRVITRRLFPRSPAMTSGLACALP